MGCGKTTIGEALARQLDCKFIDLDSFITAREHLSPAEIIQTRDETSFRRIETLALRDVLEDRHARVIALGGGTWSLPENRTLIALHDCLSIWLDASFELCWNRITANPETVRPMAPDRETGAARFGTRRNDYALAERKVGVGDSDNPETIVKRILTQL